MFDLLNQLAPETDLEAIRQIAIQEYSVDPFGVYCLHTGRKVGTYDSDVIQFAVEEEVSEDLESLADALVTRCVASMRPTPMLNRPDRITLLNLALKRPLDILSYLWNRLYSNSYLATHRIDSIAPYISRIHAFDRWAELAGTGAELSPWIHWLLEIDAKRNLHEVTPPRFTKTTTGRWIESRSPDAQELLEVLTEENLPELLTAFESWVFYLIKQYDLRDKQAESQANWMRGNSLSQVAYSRSWIDNPEIAGRKPTPKKKAKPKSQATTKLNVKVSQFLGLLDEVLDGKVEATPVKPKAKPLTGGMLFRKKESN